MPQIPAPARPKKLLDQMAEHIRVRHLALSTERSYVGWARRFILFHNKRHPREMGVPEVTEFLTHLAVEGHVSASTQNQALNAIVFLYKHVLATPLGDGIDAVRAKRPRRLPVVLSRDEVRRLLAALEGTYQLMGRMLYGGGLRLMECVRLRVKDVDFGLAQLIVRDGKGEKDRVTILARSLRTGTPGPLRRRDHDDLYARAQSARDWRREPAGYDLGCRPVKRKPRGHPSAVTKAQSSAGDLLRFLSFFGSLCLGGGFPFGSPESQGRGLCPPVNSAKRAHLKGSMSGGVQTLGIAVRSEHISLQVVGTAALSRA